MPSILRGESPTVGRKSDVARMQPLATREALPRRRAILYHFRPVDLSENDISVWLEGAEHTAGL